MTRRIPPLLGVLFGLVVGACTDSAQVDPAPSLASGVASTPCAISDNRIANSPSSVLAFTDSGQVPLELVTATYRPCADGETEDAIYVEGSGYSQPVRGMGPRPRVTGRLPGRAGGEARFMVAPIHDDMYVTATIQYARGAREAAIWRAGPAGVWEFEFPERSSWLSIHLSTPTSDETFAVKIDVSLP